MRSLFAAIAMLFAVHCAWAAEAAPAAADPQVEKRVMTLAEELRCLVCQNQSLADSHADLAVDLRNQVREKVKQGMSDRQIVDYMVERYGDFVLYRPPVKMTTLLLWFGPLLLVLIGVGVLYRTLKMRSAADLPQLSDAESERARRLLRHNEGESV
jgi:cytochrome c-type biogenesis protein CcmH